MILMMIYDIKIYDIMILNSGATFYTFGLSDAISALFIPLDVDGIDSDLSRLLTNTTRPRENCPIL